MYVKIDDEGRYSVGMENYQKNVVESHYGEGAKADNQTDIHAGNDLFEVKDDGAKLSEVDRRKFHSPTAGVLYLTNRIQPAVKIAWDLRAQG